MKTTKFLLPLATALAATVVANLQAQTVPLASTWSSYDPIGLLSISNQSPSGYTAFIATNATGSGNSQVPRVFQYFADRPFTTNGARLAAQFDLVVNNPMVVGDTQLRFGFVNTNVNEMIYAMYDIGTPGGTTIRSRMDPSFQSGVTVTTNEITGAIGGEFGHVQGIWNHSHNSGFNLTGALGINSPSLTPNGVGIGVTGSLSTRHHFRFSVERTPTSLLQDFIWGNDAGPATANASGMFDESINSTNSVQYWDRINAFGIHIFNNGAFGAAGGSYTISNLRIYYGFEVSAIRRDNATKDVEITWESSPYDSLNGANYVVELATNLNPPVVWSPIATNTSIASQADGFWTSYTNSATADAQQFYRVSKYYQP